MLGDLDPKRQHPSDVMGACFASPTRGVRRDLDPAFRSNDVQESCISPLLGIVLSWTLRACWAPVTGNPAGSSRPICTRTDA